MELLNMQSLVAKCWKLKKYSLAKFANFVHLCVFVLCFVATNFVKLYFLVFNHILQHFLAKFCQSSSQGFPFFPNF